jgi:hypothetical protein
MMENIGLPAVSHLRLKTGLDPKKSDSLWYCLQHISHGAKMHRKKMAASNSLTTTQIQNTWRHTPHPRR